MLEKIVQRRKQLGISQAVMADKIGVTIGTMSNFENGKNGLSSKKLFEMLEYLDMYIGIIE